MKALDRKLVRDLLHLWAQAAAICLVMACGAATFVMSLSTLSSLELTQADYYERCRFADVFAHLKRAPDSLAARIAEIPGVARVQTRVVKDVTLDVPGLAEPAVGRLVSIPETPTPGLNDLLIRDGRTIAPGRRGEALVGEAFAEAHGLKPGDTVTAVVNGRKEPLTLVGVALSPEYVYAIRQGDLLPDNKRFGVFWMGDEELSSAFDMKEAFNDVAVALTPGASEEEVIQRLDRLTEPYGGLGAFGRADQTSHKFVANEMTQLRGMALLPPAIFLTVTAFLLHVVLSRLVGVQREQIAALKAFGYTRREIGLHYLKLVFVLVLAGTAAGTATGAYLGWGMTRLYAQFFRFPEFLFRLDPGVVLLVLLVVGAAATAGALRAVWGAVRLPPAEAMRPEPPADFRPTLAERLGLQRLLAPPARMILRQLSRQPVKAGLTCLGIALAFSVLVLGNYVEDAVDYVIAFQFLTAQRQDVTVTFVEPASGRLLHDLRHLPGVRYAEPFRSLAVRVRFGHRSRRIGITGLEPDGKLYRLMDAGGRVVPLPAEGLVVSSKLAGVLECRVGDTLTVEVLEGARPTREAVVTGLVSDYSAPAAYMDVRAVRRLMREGDDLSGAFLAVDPAREGELYAALKGTPKVAGVSVKKAVLRSFEETLAENILRMKAFIVAFAAAIAFGVVYNAARVSLSERAREMATLRILGFTRAEISLILLGELAVLTLAALPLGMAFGFGFAALATVALDTEMQRFPLVVYASTYAFAAAVTLAAVLVSGLVVRRRLDRLDLVAVLKARE